MKKIYWIVLAIIVILIGLGIAGYWYYKIWYFKITTGNNLNLHDDIGTVVPPSPTSLSSTIISPSLTTSSGQVSKIKIFLIAPDDNGKTGKAIGCGDSVIGVEIDIEPTQTVLKAAYEKLLALRTADYGQSGLKNPLSNSNLVFESAKVENGKATILLSGSLNSAGSCEDPRIQAQLEETARQFSNIETIEIFLNGKPINDYLSGEGPGA